MESNKREIAKFYEQVFSDTKLKEKLEEKAKAIVNEEDLKNLIQQEIVPLMKKYNVNFSEKELLEYEEETLKKLSKEDLDDVSGGVSIKPMLGTGLLALTLMGVAATGQTSNAMFNGDDDDNGGKPQSSFFGGLLGAVKSLLPGSQAQTPEQLESVRRRFNTAKNELPEILIKNIEENDILSKRFVIDDNGNLYEKVEIKDSNEFAIGLWCREGQTECEIPAEVTDYNGVRRTVDTFCGADGVEKLTISSKVKNIKIRAGAVENLKIVDFAAANSSANIILDSFVFAHAENLKSVIFPRKAGNINITIGENAFWKCKNLEEVNINAKTVEVGEDAFLGTKVNKLNVKAKNFICADNTGVPVNQERFENAAKELPEAIRNSPKFNLNRCLIDKNGNLYEGYTPENSDKVSIDLLVKEGQTEFQIPEKVCDLYGKEFTVGKIHGDQYRSMKNIQKVTVDPALKELEIGDFCFSGFYYGNSNLKTVNLSGVDNLTIKLEGFSKCESLESVNINAENINIGPFAFRDCKNLREANIKGNFVNLEFASFKYCNNLKTVNFSEDCSSVKIGEYAFADTAIKELTIPADNVTCADNIGVPWQDKNGNLHAIVYENAPVPTNINMDLNEQILPIEEQPLNIDYDSNGNSDNYNDYSENDDDEEQIEEEAPRVNQERFDNAAKKLPEAIGNSPYFEVENCVMDKNGNLYEWLEIKGSDKVRISLLVKIGQKEWQTPKKVFDIDGKEYIVGEIYSDQYGSMKNLEKLTAEQDVENININSFPEGSNLKIIDFSATHLRECIIGDVAFLNCHNLISLLLPEGVEKMTLEDSAFSGCENLSKVNINAQNISIKERAFANCTSLEEANISGESVGIEKKAFTDCTNLKKVDINGKKISIGESAFKDCTSLEKANISGENVSVGESAFKDCTSLEEANISGKSVSIGEQAFDSCKNLKTLDINGKEISIEKWAFDDCDNLEKVNFSEDCNSVKIEEYALSSKKLVLKIPAENVTCAEDIGVVWYDKDGNRHPELSADDSEEESSESHSSSSNSADDNDNDNDNANNIDLDNNDEQSSNTDNDNLNYAPQISYSIKYSDLIKNIRDNLDGQQQKDYDKATRQRGAEVGTNGSSIFIFIRDDNNPNEVTITHVFTPSSLVFADFPQTIITGKTVSGQEDLQETVNVVNINLDKNADLALKNLAEEFNRKVRIANINYSACNKPNRFGFGGDALDVAAKNLISVLKQIKSLEELDETSRKNVITDIKYLYSYVKPNGNEFYLEDTFKSYTGINNLELIEQFYKSCKNE